MLLWNWCRTCWSCWEGEPSTPPPARSSMYRIALTMLLCCLLVAQQNTKKNKGKGNDQPSDSTQPAVRINNPAQQENQQQDQNASVDDLIRVRVNNVTVQL